MFISHIQHNNVREQGVKLILSQGHIRRNMMSRGQGILTWSERATVADPGENLTGALHSNFGRGGCGGRG